jgi:hypothetical protein
MSRRIWTAWLTIGALGAAGCVADKQYRKQSVYYEKLHVADYDPTQLVDLPGDEGAYRLAFVEFNDRGQLFDPAQLQRAIDLVTAARKAAAADPPLVAVFVHGWKNNASDQSGNVWGFRQVLAGLAFQYSKQRVVGIYIGWRGSTIEAPILKEFTVFDRHHASQRVPVPVMVGSMKQVIAAAKDDVGKPPAKGPAATLVMIGHSFGGAVLETALTPTLSAAIADARARNQPTVTWPADLIMLLNEAQEAERSYPLIEQMNAQLQPRGTCVPPNGGTPKNTRPAVLSISSTGDVATRGYFPGEQLIARPFQRQTYDGKDPYQVGKARLYYETTAHISTLRSHVFGRADDPDVEAALAACKPTLDLTLSLGERDFKYRIVPRDGAPNQTPYWVMHMPTSIVPDHSTIFTQVLRDFVVSLIGQAMLLPPQNQLRPQPLQTSR